MRTTKRGVTDKRFRDLRGQTFGRLSPKSFLTRRQRGYWICLCECGQWKEISTRCLTKGRVKSCGCLSEETKADTTNKVRGAKSPHWKGGVENYGSLAYCNNRISSMAGDAKRSGSHIPIFTGEHLCDYIANHNSHCEICGATGKLDIDHDHATGELRGLLCGKCNRGIGSFDDSPAKLQLAIRYLSNERIEDSK